MKKVEFNGRKRLERSFLAHAEIKEIKEIILLSKLLGFRGFDEVDKGI